MNDGTDIPTGWSLWTGAGTPKLSRDTKNFQAGPASLRLDGSPDAYGAAGQELTVVKAPFTLSGYLKTTPNIEESNVAIRAVDDQGKQIEWIPLSSGPTATWTRWEKTVTLPPNTARATLTATIKGEGTVWLDELSAQLADGAPNPAPAPPAPTVALANGDMTLGKDAPDGWTQGWTASGKLQLVRDEAEFHSVPASLCLGSENGAAEGGAGLPLTGKGAFTLSGQVKTSGSLENALVAVQSFGADGKQVGWTTLCDAKGATAWTAFRLEGKIPDNAVSAQVVVVFKGNGKIWLDDLHSR